LPSLLPHDPRDARSASRYRKSLFSPASERTSPSVAPTTVFSTPLVTRTTHSHVRKSEVDLRWTPVSRQEMHFLKVEKYTLTLGY
jgi:hypothetical protein